MITVLNNVNVKKRGKYETQTMLVASEEGQNFWMDYMLLDIDLPRLVPNDTVIQVRKSMQNAGSTENKERSLKAAQRLGGQAFVINNKVLT